MCSQKKKGVRHPRSWTDLLRQFVIASRLTHVLDQYVGSEVSKATARNSVPLRPMISGQNHFILPGTLTGLSHEIPGNFQLKCKVGR